MTGPRRFDFVLLALRPAPAADGLADVLAPRGGWAPRLALSVRPYAGQALAAARDALGGAPCRLRLLCTQTGAVVVDVFGGSEQEDLTGAPPSHRTPWHWHPMCEVLQGRAAYSGGLLPDRRLVTAARALEGRLGLACPQTFHLNCPCRVLYHGTRSETAARSILAEGVRPSKEGMFGPCVYLAEFHKAARFAMWDQKWRPQSDPWVVRCVAMLGPRLDHSVTDPTADDPVCRCKTCASEPDTQGHWKKHRMLDHLGAWRLRADVLVIRPAEHRSNDYEFVFADPSLQLIPIDAVRVRPATGTFDREAPRAILTDPAKGARWISASKLPRNHPNCAFPGYPGGCDPGPCRAPNTPPRPPPPLSDPSSAAAWTGAPSEAPSAAPSGPEQSIGFPTERPRKSRWGPALPSSALSPTRATATAAGGGGGGDAKKTGASGPDPAPHRARVRQQPPHHQPRQKETGRGEECGPPETRGPAAETGRRAGHPLVRPPGEPGQAARHEARPEGW